MVFGWLFFLSVMPDWLGVIIGVLAGLWVLATFGAFVEGWKRRASDLVSVTGLNVVPVAVAQTAQLGELRGALSQRLQTRRRYRWLSLTALLLLGIAALALWPVRGALRARRAATVGAKS